MWVENRKTGIANANIQRELRMNEGSYRQRLIIDCKQHANETLFAAYYAGNTDGFAYYAGNTDGFACSGYQGALFDGRIEIAPRRVDRYDLLQPGHLANLVRFAEPE
tara:strand:+ start:189 stop:509 length:321 start_codon:yes stop_codon:yes gene_type:complete